MNCRSFIQPSPHHRTVADNISNFITAVQSSLRVGTVRNSKFLVSFRCDVFVFLFHDKGSGISGKRGRMFSEADFDLKYFSSDWFVSYDKLGDGCKIQFPIHLNSFVRFSPLTYTKDSNDDIIVPRPRDFTELLSVSIV